MRQFMECIPHLNKLVGLWSKKEEEKYLQAKKCGGVQNMKNIRYVCKGAKKGLKTHLDVLSLLFRSLCIHKRRIFCRKSRHSLVYPQTNTDIIFFLRFPSPSVIIRSSINSWYDPEIVTVAEVQTKSSRLIINMSPCSPFLFV